MGAVDSQRDGPPLAAGTAAPVCMDAVIAWLIASSLRLAASLVWIGHRCATGCKLERARRLAHRAPREIVVGQQIEELAAFVASARWDDIPDPVRRHTKLVLLDTLGVILAGGERPE